MTGLQAAIQSAIADPNIAFLLLTCGLLSLYFEFMLPGAFVPGVFGGVILLLGISALSSASHSWNGLALLCIAMAFFGLEIKLTAHGILAIGGMAALIFGALLLNVSLSTALLVSIPFGLITTFLLSLALQARRNKVLTGAATMIHEVGVAATEIKPEGQVLVRGEYWTATSPFPVKSGERVRVTAVHGLRLEVEPWV